MWAQTAVDVAAFDEDAMVLFKLILGGLAASILAFLWMWRWFWKRLGGFTGDCLGATQQMCELAFYLGLTLSL
jgi:adenosylcobinamide-GDP ribazoletransferase